VTVVTAIADLVVKAMCLPGARQTVEARMTLKSEPAEK
jgi:hypothetical protein